MGAAGLDLRQPDRGYRFSIDSFLLAGFVRPRARERILDAGAGVGVVGLLIANRNPSVTCTAIEVQPGLARHAGENARRNDLGGRFHVVRGDLRDAPAFIPPDIFDRVVANPPYHPPRSGRVSPHPGRAVARQEMSFSMSELARTAAALLRFGGRLDLIFPTERIPETIRELSDCRLESKILRLVTPFPGATPRRCLLSAKLGARPGLVVLPELAIHEAPGRYTAEVELLCAQGRPGKDRVRVEKEQK